MNFRNLFYLLWIAFCIGADGKRQLWGEITLNIIGRQDEVKYRLPFFTRQSIIPFPSELNTLRPFDHTYFIRGISHYSRLDQEECLPELEIIEGGIYQNNATVQITSKRGCGIDSTIIIYGDRFSRHY